MTDKKLTAVEWLIESMEEQVGRIDHVNNRIHIDVSFEDFMEMKKQAKALEREQIEEAYNAGYDHGYVPTEIAGQPFSYYERTFENNS